MITGLFRIPDESTIRGYTRIDDHDEDTLDGALDCLIHELDEKGRKAFIAHCFGIRYKRLGYRLALQVAKAVICTTVVEAMRAVSPENRCRAARIARCDEMIRILEYGKELV